MKRALLIGGSSPLGMAIRGELEAHSISVISTYNENKCGGESLRLDVTSEESFEALRRELERVNLDYIVYNSGIFTESSQRDLETDVFDRVFSVNMRGLFLTWKYFGEKLDVSRGSLVAVSSMNALHPGSSTSHYDASKGALTSYVRSLSAETGLRINAVAPGLLSSSRINNSDFAESFRRHTLTHSLVELKDVACLVYFLLKCESIYGQTILIDNGYTLK